MIIFPANGQHKEKGSNFADANFTFWWVFTWSVVIFTPSYSILSEFFFDNVVWLCYKISLTKL